MHQTFNVRR